MKLSWISAIAALLLICASAYQQPVTRNDELIVETIKSTESNGSNLSGLLAISFAERNGIYTNCSPYVGSDYGEINWRLDLKTDTDWREPLSGPGRFISEPVIDERGMIYVQYEEGSRLWDIYPPDGIVMCINPNGEVAWEIATHAAAGPRLTVLEDGTVCGLGLFVAPYGLKRYDVVSSSKEVFFTVDKQCRLDVWYVTDEMYNALPAAIGNSSIIVAFGNERVNVVDLSGCELCKEGLQTYPGYYGQACSSANGHAYLLTQHELHALSRDLKPLWITNLELRYNSEPVLETGFELGGEPWYEDAVVPPVGPVLDSLGRIYVGIGAHQLIALSTDGEMLWRKHLRVPGSMPAASPDGLLYVMDPAARIWLIDETGNAVLFYDASSALVMCEAKAYYLYGCGRRFQDRSFGDIMCDAAGSLFFSLGEALYSVSAEGQLRWVVELSAVAYTRPVISEDGAIYVCCTDGSLYAIGP